MPWRAAHRSWMLAAPPQACQEPLANPAAGRTQATVATKCWQNCWQPWCCVRRQRQLQGQRLLPRGPAWRPGQLAAGWTAGPHRVQMVRQGRHRRCRLPWCLAWWSLRLGCAPFRCGGLQFLSCGHCPMLQSAVMKRLQEGRLLRRGCQFHPTLPALLRTPTFCPASHLPSAPLSIVRRTSRRLWSPPKASCTARNDRRQTHSWRR